MTCRLLQEMSHVMMHVVAKNEGAREFAVRGLNGWAVDDFSSVVSRVYDDILTPSMPA